MASAKGKHKKGHSEGGHHDDDDDHGSHGHAEHAEEGEPWLVSYADMMTLLFGFFVVMYSFAAKDPKDQECVRLKLMEAFKDLKADSDSPSLSGATMQGAALKALQMMVTLLNLESVEDVMEKIAKEAERKEIEKTSDIKEDLKEKSIAEQIKAMIGADESRQTVTIAIPADVVFHSGTSQLTPESKTKVLGIIQGIKRYDDLEEIEIVGHTDSVPAQKNSNFDNWTLSVVRANAVGQLFIGQGFSPRNLKIAGRGSSSPLVPEFDQQGRRIPENMQRNRRIEIVLKREKPHG